jgi:glycosyltransferase involved in cell wall biosynthesis
MEKIVNNPVRVLQIFTVLNRGGAETMIMNYYRHIDRTRVQFDFAVHRQERGAYEDEIEALGGKIYRFLPFHPKNFRAYRKQISRFFDEHPEYRIVHGHVSEFGYFFYKEAGKHNVPCIIYHSHIANMNIDMKIPFHLLFRVISRKYATDYFACGKAAARWLFGEKSDKSVYIQKNAIEPALFLYNKDVASKMKKQMNLENKFVICHIGRFAPQKNHSFLIDIFNEVYKRNSSAVLLLIGDGDLRDSIEEKVDSLNLKMAVLFLGIRKDIPNLLQLSDLFLFPSNFEGLSVVTIEAQAAGLKCILSDSVSSETAIISDLVEFVSLKKGADYWANEILKYADGYNRKDTLADIRNAGYDVSDAVKWLEQFYLEKAMI